MMADEIKFTSTIDVELIRCLASDEYVAQAARVSTATDTRTDKPFGGLINALIRDRHGSCFEHGMFTFRVHAPIFVFREWMRHRAGWCVAGDTEITTESWGRTSGRTTRRVRIDELHDRWHNGVQDSRGRVRHLASVRNQKVRVLNEETMLFELGSIDDVIMSGEKELHTFRTETGQTLRCTEDHMLFTNEGWIRAVDLESDHLLTVTGKRPINPTRQVPPSLRQGINVWTMMQRNTLIKPTDFCHVCGDRFSKDDLGMDHVIPVAKDLTRALDVTNLRPICRECDKTKTAEEQTLAVRGNTAGGKFVRYERTGTPVTEMTYDLSVNGPWHSFMANGIVAHNSYNEQSGRYTTFAPVFYVPGPDRPLAQSGKPMDYDLRSGTEHQREYVPGATRHACSVAWDMYEAMLDQGVAREVARGVLPVTTYSSMYATCNPRSLMHFLSLRTADEGAAYPSKPQWEIDRAARELESHFMDAMPLTWTAWNEHGRVAP